VTVSRTMRTTQVVNRASCESVSHYENHASCEHCVLFYHNSNMQTKNLCKWQIFTSNIAIRFQKYIIDTWLKMKELLWHSANPEICFTKNFFGGCCEFLPFGGLVYTRFCKIQILYEERFCTTQKTNRYTWYKININRV